MPSSTGRLSPLEGTPRRYRFLTPPGWRAPLDWATYPRSHEQTQSTPAPGMPPPYALKALDWQHGENGRLIYNCEPYKYIGGGLCR